MKIWLIFVVKNVELNETLKELNIEWKTNKNMTKKHIKLLKELAEEIRNGKIKVKISNTKEGYKYIDLEADNNPGENPCRLIVTPEKILPNKKIKTHD
jgi:hypothetical protein